ncbi:hypothetical protein BGW38_006208 [Lunasporangiospora selenospora]|uniref:ER membrane protein complex subunit 4 n=1 Tax=Lunasporangiospora selenospora TaxID=979761 RepID=A0A9P6FZV8_9FUNG|nr:hypothetical protein BGW38_006208 [Lunasporangiospora selenospora]
MANQRWRFEFYSPDNPKRSVVDPPGFVATKDVYSHGQSSVKGQGIDNEHLKIKKAWDVALAPGKQLPMQAFMLWMSGNSVQIFSVAITGMLMVSPIRALMSMGAAFERYESTRVEQRAGAGLLSGPLALPKLAFIALQIMTILLGMWKLNAMGLLPTSSSDWLAFLDPKVPLEFGAAPSS